MTEGVRKRAERILISLDNPGDKSRNEVVAIVARELAEFRREVQRECLGIVLTALQDTAQCELLGNHSGKEVWATIGKTLAHMRENFGLYRKDYLERRAAEGE